MEQYRQKPTDTHASTHSTVKPTAKRDPMLESTADRVNTLLQLVEQQQRQIRRMESQIFELQRFLVSSKQ